VSITTEITAAVTPDSHDEGGTGTGTPTATGGTGTGRPRPPAAPGWATGGTDGHDHRRHRDGLDDRRRQRAGHDHRRHGTTSTSVPVQVA
jgi:hypothetical protein